MTYLVFLVRACSTGDDLRAKAILPRVPSTTRGPGETTAVAIARQGGMSPPSRTTGAQNAVARPGKCRSARLPHWRFRWARPWLRRRDGPSEGKNGYGAPLHGGAVPGKKRIITAPGRALIVTVIIVVITVRVIRVMRRVALVVPELAVYAVGRKQLLVRATLDRSPA